MFEWNPVFNFVMNIKHNYLKKFGKVEYKKYEIEENDTTNMVNSVQPVMVNTKLLLKTSGMQIMDFSWSAEVW